MALGDDAHLVLAVLLYTLYIYNVCFSCLWPKPQESNF